MGAKGTKTVRVNHWLSETPTLLRIEQLVALTHRTVLIKDLLCVPDEEEAALRRHIKGILDKRGEDYTFPRGRSGATNPKAYLSNVRFAMACLMGMLNASDDGCVVADSSGSICSFEQLDRLINVYQRYLQLNRVTPQDADVTFEFFIYSWRFILEGKASLEYCHNCGSTHYNFTVAPSHSCPVCTQLKLAVQVSRDEAPISSQISHRTRLFGN